MTATQQRVFDVIKRAGKIGIGEPDMCTATGLGVSGLTDVLNVLIQEDKVIGRTFDQGSSYLFFLPENLK